MEKKQRKPRTKKPFPSKKDDFIKDKVTKTPANDPNWYLVNGQLAKDVASFSFNNAVGDRVLRTPMQSAEGKQLRNSVLRMPGIASIFVAPSIGVANWENSPVNVAAKDIYSFVRHANSGHANYDPADLMIYLLAADSVQTFWSYMVRAYGVCRTFSQVNRYVGDAMLTAMGINPDDLRGNLAQFRAYINQFAIKASVLAVPNTMTYFTRHSWLFQNIYLDEDNPKGQMYMYVPALLYRYALDENSAGMLQTIRVAMYSSNAGTLSPRAMTWAQIKNVGDGLLNAMLSQEDVGIMSGDILKAYGSDKLLRYAQIDENFAISPIFSEEVLAQIHNTEFTGCLPLKNDGTDASGIKWTVNYNGLDIKQDMSLGHGWLVSEPAFANATRLAYEPLLDVWKWDVSPELALVASRNKIMGMPVGGTVYTGSGAQTSYVPVTIQTCGSELPIDIVIYVYDESGAITTIGTWPGGTESFNTTAIIYSTKFNEYPILTGVVQDIAGIPYGEISNYTVLSFEDVDAMHHTALLSMFGVPYRW